MGVLIYNNKRKSQLKPKTRTALEEEKLTSLELAVKTV